MKIKKFNHYIREGILTFIDNFNIDASVSMETKPSVSCHTDDKIIFTVYLPPGSIEKGQVSYYKGRFPIK